MPETWSEWAGKKYNNNYNAYVPWLEDKYLSWYGENKTSYTAKGMLLAFVCTLLLPRALHCNSLEQTPFLLKLYAD